MRVDCEADLTCFTRMVLQLLHSHERTSAIALLIINCSSNVHRDPSKQRVFLTVQSTEQLQTSREYKASCSCYFDSFCLIV